MVQFLTLDQAAHRIPDGCTLGIGGMTLYRRPVALVRALLARAARPRDLTLLAMTCGYESDVLVGAGCVAAVRTAYFGLEAFGFAPMFTQFANAGVLRIIEETEASIVFGLRAHISKAGFIPSPAWVGTDLARLRPDVQTVANPYTGELLTAFPAIPVDVALLHALEADERGNVKINNNLGIDLELVFAATTTIVTVERMVAHITKSTDGMVIPAPGASIIVVAPGGARPTSCHPDYKLQGSALLAYTEACSAGDFDGYLARWLAPPNGASAA
ncbi:MAG: CoA transferase subunit A, partial [Armatimonadetes bacterium]|nr:CoA transferase subunit A [Anaerolineae bacterium]